MSFKPRKSWVKDKNKTLWIFCWWKTEELYFSSFKVRNGVNIKPRFNGVAGVNLLDYAIWEIEKIQNKDRLDLFYIVFDRDPGNNTERQIKKIISWAKENNIIPIISNRSFELWIILHFNQFKRVVSSNDDYMDILTVKLWYQYSKTDKSLWDTIRSKLDIALLNSKVLEDTHITDWITELELTEPYTNVYLLINDILN